MKHQVSEANMKRLMLGEMSGEHKQRLPITSRNARRLAKKQAKKPPKKEG